MGEILECRRWSHSVLISKAKGIRVWYCIFAYRTFYSIKMKIDVVEIKLVKGYQLLIPGDNEYVCGVQTAMPIFCKIIGANNVEYVALLCMDSTNKVINFSKISVGNIENVQVSISQILKVALLSNASKIIIAHNHPSGILEITAHDIDMTKKIGALAAYFDIELIDSLVVNANDAVSIREHIGEKNNG